MIKRALDWLIWSDLVFDAFMVAIAGMLCSLPVLVYWRIYG